MSDFQSISVPLALDDPAPEAFLGPQIGSYDTSQYRVGRWNPSSGAYDEYPNVTSFLPGHAYWFLARSGLDIFFQGSASPTTLSPDGSNNGVRVTLAPGWNQVGNPYTAPMGVFNVLVEDVGTSDWEPLSDGTITQGIFWVFSGGGYSPASILDVHTGGWIKKTVPGPGWVYFLDGGLNPPVNTIGNGASRTAVDDSVERPPAPPGMDSGGGGSGGGGGGCFLEEAGK